MRLVRLIYISRTQSSFGHEDIQSILLSSRKNNSASSITGMLVFNSNYFIQCLEGGREAVNATFQRISQDQRHKQILLLGYSEIAVREFEHWNMGYASMVDIDKDKLFKFSIGAEVDPYVMSGESAHQLLLSFRSQAA